MNNTTNSSFIRNTLSDYELADMIVNNDLFEIACQQSNVQCDNLQNKNCKQCVLEWLQNNVEK